MVLEIAARIIPVSHTHRPRPQVSIPEGPCISLPVLCWPLRIPGLGNVEGAEEAPAPEKTAALRSSHVRTTLPCTCLVFCTGRAYKSILGPVPRSADTHCTCYSLLRHVSSGPSCLRLRDCISLEGISAVPTLGTGTGQVVLLQKTRAVGPGREERLGVSTRTGVFPNSLWRVIVFSFQFMSGKMV